MQSFSNVQAHSSLKVETRNTHVDFKATFLIPGPYPTLQPVPSKLGTEVFKSPTQLPAVHAYSNEMPKTLKSNKVYRQFNLIPPSKASAEHVCRVVSSTFAKLRIIHYLDLRSPAVRCQTATHVRVWAFVTRCYIVTEWSVLHLLGTLGPWCNPRIDLMDHCESLSTFGLEAMGSLISISLTAVTTLNSRGGRKTKAASSRCLV